MNPALEIILIVLIIGLGLAKIYQTSKRRDAFVNSENAQAARNIADKSGGIQVWYTDHEPKSAEIEKAYKPVELNIDKDMIVLGNLKLKASDLRVVYSMFEDRFQFKTPQQTYFVKFNSPVVTAGWGVSGSYGSRERRWMKAMKRAGAKARNGL